MIREASQDLSNFIHLIILLIDGSINLIIHELILIQLRLNLNITSLRYSDYVTPADWADLKGSKPSSKTGLMENVSTIWNPFELFALCKILKADHAF